MRVATVKGARRASSAENVPMQNAGTEEGQEWGVPNNLVAPPALPGMVQRWVRVSLRGEDHAGNFAKHRHLGWEPRPADSVDESFNAMKAKNPVDGAGIIRVHDMVLMQIPEHRVAARNRYIQERTDRQTSSVESDLLKSERPGVPFEQTRRTQVGGGNGRVPPMRQDDDEI